MLERGAYARDPPRQLLPAPSGLDRVGVHACAVRDAPPVLDEPREHAELDLGFDQMPALRDPVVGLELVVCRIYAAGGGGEVPGELDGRCSGGGEVPVDQHEAIAVEAEVVSAQVAMDQRRSALCTKERLGQRLRPADEIENRLRDVTGNEIGERAPALLELLWQEVRI